MKLVDILLEAKAVKSKSDFNRLIKQRGIKVIFSEVHDGKIYVKHLPITDANYSDVVGEEISGDIVVIGKRHFYKIKGNMRAEKIVPDTECFETIPHP